MATALRVTALMSLALAAGTSFGAAQVCAGNAGFESTPIRINGGIDIGDGYTSFGGGVSLGKPNQLFYGAGLALVSPEFGDNGLAISGAVGKELERPIGDRLRLCPFAGISHLTDAGFGGSATDFSVGGVVGYPLASGTGNSTQFVLTGGYTGVYQRYSVVGGSAEEWYGIIDAGVGIILSNNLSLVPGLRLYFRHSGSPGPSILLRGNYGLSRR